MDYLGIEFRLRELIQVHGNWADRVFGTKEMRGARGPLKHMVKEIQEEMIEEEVRDIEEYADLMFLWLDAFRRDGYTFDQVLSAAEKKMLVNLDRKHPESSPTEAVEHIRTKEEILAKIQGLEDKVFGWKLELEKLSKEQKGGE